MSVLEFALVLIVTFLSYDLVEEAWEPCVLHIESLLMDDSHRQIQLLQGAQEDDKISNEGSEYYKFRSYTRTRITKRSSSEGFTYANYARMPYPSPPLYQTDSRFVVETEIL